MIVIINPSWRYADPLTLSKVAILEWNMRNMLKPKKKQFSDFYFYEIWSILYSNFLLNQGLWRLRLRLFANLIQKR